jgi:hypothetical protein
LWFIIGLVFEQILNLKNRKKNKVWPILNLLFSISLPYKKPDANASSFIF